MVPDDEFFSPGTNESGKPFSSAAMFLLAVPPH
jgi:hypothetical protein